MVPALIVGVGQARLLLAESAPAANDVPLGIFVGGGRRRARLRQFGGREHLLGRTLHLTQHVAALQAAHRFHDPSLETLAATFQAD